MKYNNLDNANKHRRILSVSSCVMPDEDCDLSYYGEYAKTPDPRFSIDRKARGDMRHGECRYFNPSSNYDREGMDELVKYTEQDYARVEAYNAGVWRMVGFKAFAKIQLGTTVIQTITSGGLWGTESDSEPGYLAEQMKEQLADLRIELKACGFSDVEINLAYRSVQTP